MSISKNNFAILVLSCDKFEDTWKPFFKLFYCNFKDCNLPLYLGSNTKKYNDKKVTTVLSGPDSDWSSSLLNIINQISEEYLLILLDDMFITSQVDEVRLMKCFSFMRDFNVKHMHLNADIKPASLINNEHGQFGVYKPGMPYTVNVLGFWDKTYLDSILIVGESPWNFEIMGSYRASYDSGFYCLTSNLFNVLHGIEKGMWFDLAINYLVSQKLIDISEISRPVLKGKSKIKSTIQSKYFNTIKLVPWKLRIKFMNLLRKLLISY